MDQDDQARFEENEPKPRGEPAEDWRERIHRLRGKYKGAGLLKALMEERKREREKEERDIERLT